MTTVLDRVKPLMCRLHRCQSASVTHESLTLFASEMPLVYCHYNIQVYPILAGNHRYHVPETVFGPSPTFDSTSSNSQKYFLLIKFAKKWSQNVNKYIGYSRLLAGMGCVQFVVPSGDYNAAYF